MSSPPWNYPYERKSQIIIPTMRGVLQFLWMGLVLVIVALLSALIAMRLAVHGREVSVPDMQGKPPSEARKLAEDRGLTVEIEREYYSPTIAAGRVVSQMPAAGTVVRRGWQVRLAVSLGPQRVAIPQVIGESEHAATISLGQRGLDISSTARVGLPGAVVDTVVGQAPPANATDASAPKVSLLVAQQASPQAYVMPNFVGQPLGGAANALKEAGFSIGRVTMMPTPAAAPPTSPPDTGNIATGMITAATSPLPPAPINPPAVVVLPSPSAASIIVSQEPGPGQKVEAGAAINFVVR